ncbi:DUF2399 domain-containing protein [Bacilli bacterium]|uniref:DUF2399 domain-containing protein n=1 Tax=Oceanobacillus caeni TaxID=405946 RepID=A0ABR5MMZ5_9BACI|nr:MULTISPECIES: DUF2399 domain-containing protein [Bacillaceae]KKE78471.1 hypothetical protein WH51_12235 [Bacilli bacterium VT-13-104]PZD85395.1 DUF2399 domain-containing protein [Bacilli bacterium]KPH78258.1 hypothetical protein AFL42_02385 [Oceanobacillus caeni]MBU8791285.1 DUF2399 domain-containing protein [Oceanobacillus caeni]PZD89119.1 DUF2399 domain-containing protein [Bacilli bacterium]
MIPSEWKEYLEEHILLKNEELHLIDINENNGNVDIPVIRRTARTRRTVARLTIGIVTDHTVSPPEKLVKAFSSSKVKKHLTLSDETYDWIRNGWLIREYRFEKDERTLKSEQYRMGYGLFQYQQFIQKQKEEEKKQLIHEWKTRWEETRGTGKVEDGLRLELLDLLENRLQLIANEGQRFLEGQVDKMETVNPSWRFRKQVLFLHFLVALYQIAAIEYHYDWKQIGARYYRKIGGSKEFDSYKKDFIEEAERFLERPLHLLGLASLGTITPIFFSGPMSGKKVTYSYGSVHATTDLAVFTDNFQTSAEVLWLVENRGVLTRMAYEEEFLLDSKSFVLGIDGQLRSAHRQLIGNLVPFVKQVIIWTDVDEAGLTIAKEIFQLTENEQVLTKWVVPPLEIVTDIEEFEIRYKQSIQAGKEEQEQEIGGVRYWKNWIKP